MHLPLSSQQSSIHTDVSFKSTVTFGQRLRLIMSSFHKRLCIHCVRCLQQLSPHVDVCFQMLMLMCAFRRGCWWMFSDVDVDTCFQTLMMFSDADVDKCFPMMFICVFRQC